MLLDGAKGKEQAIVPVYYKEIFITISLMQIIALMRLVDKVGLGRINWYFFPRFVLNICFHSAILFFLPSCM
jgi:hypothetical protein